MRPVCASPTRATGSTSTEAIWMSPKSRVCGPVSCRRPRRGRSGRLLENKDMLGALYHPDDGHIAPADVTQAMAKGARDLGAKVHLGNRGGGFRADAGGEWRVKTTRGDFVCEHVILATGNYARQTGAMLGLDIPAIPILHQYWITEAVPEIVDRKRMACRRCRSSGTRGTKAICVKRATG